MTAYLFSSYTGRVAKKNTILGPASPLRVVKTVQSVSLIREMDELILASAAYAGRDEFISEAIRDRIAEERARMSGSNEGALVAPVIPPSVEQESPTELTLATSWAGKIAPTLPASASDEILYGLHNRDYPTLWALDTLTQMAASSGNPPSYRDFLRTALDAAWNVGAQLEKLDRERSKGQLKAAVGFPTNAEKRESAGSRFTEHMLGVVRDGKARGPLFAFGLAGVEVRDGEARLAPTPEALELLQALAASEIRARPPHSEPAWRAFQAHVRGYAQADFGAWMRVLRQIATGKERDDIVAAFVEEWPGSAAASNVYGYVSRGREWGLVGPELTEGKYRLTCRGEQALEE